MSVADDLRLSRGKNAEFHAHQQRGRLPQALQSLTEAWSARLAADEADPDHTDLEWLNDTAPHADIMAFYAAYLAKQAPTLPQNGSSVIGAAVTAIVERQQALDAKKLQAVATAVVDSQT